MSEIKFSLTIDEIYHAESVISRQTNILEENKNLLAELKNDLNKILAKNKIHPFTGKLLIIERKKNDLSGFATPFLNLINISNEKFENIESKNLLWLVLHEYMHIFEDGIIAHTNIQENSIIKIFNDVVEKWLSKSLNLEIEINSKVIDIVIDYVYDYKSFIINSEDPFGDNFESKYGNINYDPRDLLLTYANLLKQNERTYQVPNNDEGLWFLLNSYRGCLKHWATNLGDDDLLSTSGKLISTYLLNRTLHESTLQFYRNMIEPYLVFYQVPCEARVIYFSSILINRDIKMYGDIFPIDEVKIFEAERLKQKYGTVFKVGNFVQAIKNERLSLQAKEMAFRSYMGME